MTGGVVASDGLAGTLSTACEQLPRRPNPSERDNREWGRQSDWGNPCPLTVRVDLAPLLPDLKAI